uniref:RRM domain-containing protein n=1 Tax=Bursaphelenchus xylophilus TaxID=6326 RepID=A0A1I7SMS2_BURXY
MIESKRYRRDEDPTHPSPSVVVHVRNLGPLVTEADLVDSLTPIGPVAYTTCMPNKGMALVEFESLEDARRCVSMSQTSPIDVAGAPALFNYSTSQIIQRTALESEKPNKILCLTITNLKYPINVRVIYKIANQFGTVEKISILRRNSVHALVEFETIDMSKAAKYGLNGAEIYKDCNVVKAEFARTEYINVARQDFEQWDYTIDPDGPDPTFRPSDPIPASPTAVIDQAVYNNHSLAQAQQQALKDMGGRISDHYGKESRNSSYDYPDRSRQSRFQTTPDDYGSEKRHGTETSVLMVYGVNHEQFDCDRIFNLFCCYGNVIKVKFMHSKPDTCMVQMGTSHEATNVLKYLQGAAVFNTTLAIRPSKQNVLRDLAGEPFQLGDGLPSFTDYTQSRLQRFSIPALAARNRIVYPTNQLHFFCAPMDVTESFIIDIFKSRHGPHPQNALIFNTRSDRFSSGLVTFDSPESATEALMAYNHMTVESKNFETFVLKLAFAGSKDREYRQH